MRFTLFSLLLLSASIGIAGEADVLSAEVEHAGGDLYRFKVTVQHEDEGWNHYVDHWLILDKDEQLIVVRKLMHPHVKEQPFTRSLSYIGIPDAVTEVIIRAHCSVDSYSGKDMSLKFER